MKTLGYIVTDRKLKDVEGFVEQIRDYSDADFTKPILIVGWDNAKLHRGYRNILEKELAPGVFWTFKKSESRSEFERDLKKFYRYIYDNILDGIDYYYVNILNLKYSRLKKLYSIFNSKERKNIYISDSILYTMYDGNVLGVSLEVLEYCGVKRDKVMTLLSSNPSNNIYDDSARWIIKLCRYLGNKKYAVPYFISSQ